MDVKVLMASKRTQIMIFIVHNVITNYQFSSAPESVALEPQLLHTRREGGYATPLFL